MWYIAVGTKATSLASEGHGTRGIGSSSFAEVKVGQELCYAL